MTCIFRALEAKFPQFSTPLNFEIGSNAKTVVYGPLKSDVLKLISGQVSDPSKHISFPAIGKEYWPSQAIQFISFGQSNSASAKAPFFGARYESFRDEFDHSLETVLRSRAPSTATQSDINNVSDLLDLTPLLKNWFVGLSNGQSRRAQLAQALLRKPKLLVMDEPFLGLDPANVKKISNILKGLSVPVVIGLRTGETSPPWINQILFANKDGVHVGQKALELDQSQQKIATELRKSKEAAQYRRVRENNKTGSINPVIEIKNLTLSYKNSPEPIFNNFNLSILDGERVHIQGPNGSGKSTLLALITADHPQSWSSNIILFGEKLKVGKHSYFALNRYIGHSSPELHAIFPKHLSAQRAVSTAFSNSMIPPSSLTADQQNSIENVAKKLKIDLLSSTPFGEMSLGEQKLILLARALVKRPRILLLDEAFSTLSVEQMDLAMSVVDDFRGTVLFVGHVEEEIPACDKVIRLGG